jgi:hypothetical protein
MPVIKRNLQYLPITSCILPISPILATSCHHIYTSIYIPTYFHTSPVTLTTSSSRNSKVAAQRRPVKAKRKASPLHFLRHHVYHYHPPSNSSQRIRLPSIDQKRTLLKHGDRSRDSGPESPVTARTTAHLGHYRSGRLWQNFRCRVPPPDLWHALPRGRYCKFLTTVPFDLMNPMGRVHQNYQHSPNLSSVRNDT